MFHIYTDTLEASGREIQHHSRFFMFDQNLRSPLNSTGLQVVLKDVSRCVLVEERSVPVIQGHCSRYH